MDIKIKVNLLFVVAIIVLAAETTYADGWISFDTDMDGPFVADMDRPVMTGFDDQRIIGDLQEQISVRQGEIDSMRVRIKDVQRQSFDASFRETPSPGKFIREMGEGIDNFMHGLFAPTRKPDYYGVDPAIDLAGVGDTGLLYTGHGSVEGNNQPWEAHLDEIDKIISVWEKFIYIFGISDTMPTIRGGGDPAFSWGWPGNEDEPEMIKIHHDAKDQKYVHLNCFSKRLDRVDRWYLGRHFFVDANQNGKMDCLSEALWNENGFDFFQVINKIGFDSVKDGVLDSRDDGWSDLKMYDTRTGTVSTMQDEGIMSINIRLAYRVTGDCFGDDNSSYTRVSAYIKDDAYYKCKAQMKIPARNLTKKNNLRVMAFCPKCVLHMDKKTGVSTLHDIANVVIGRYP